MSSTRIPSPAEHAGGLPAFQKLTACFYGKVAKDELLAPVFAHMSAEHPAHVAAFLAQCSGLGPVYSGDGSENEAMRKMVGERFGWGSVRGPYEAVGSICNFPVDEKIIP